MKLLIKPRQWVAAICLLALASLAIVGLVLTRDSAAPSNTSARKARLVDERSLRTARAIAKLASGWEEQRLAQQALTLADHEVDVAFASALRGAAQNAPKPTPQTQAIYNRISSAEALVKASQERVEQLKKQIASSSSSSVREQLQRQLDLTQAQLELDQDELDDAKGDLVRSGADPLSRIQRQFSRHQATQQADEARPRTTGNNSDSEPAAGNLITQFTAWRTLREKGVQLQQAREDALHAAKELSQKHDSLEAQVEADKTDKPARAESAKQPDTGASRSAASPATATAAITSLRQLSSDQKDLADLDKRIQDQQELADVYSNWLLLVQSRQRSALHGMIVASLWIVITMLAVFVAGRVLERVLSDVSLEHGRKHTLRVVIRFVIQALGLFVILFVLFGVPNQISTILGLAGAGLTVALKDFLIAFFGWFVLMGRNGIHVGDWVEINGVAGEVAEINLLRTVLLETGNWTDTGLPTGRKVAFMNGFAIEGHFFNFSTSGQWLWDELEVTVPSTQDPYPLLEAVQSIVAKETQANAQAAEQESRGTIGKYSVQSVSGTPEVSLRPTASGLNVHVRYITRAQERYAMRVRLNQALVGLLHHRGIERNETEEQAAR